MHHAKLTLAKGSSGAHPEMPEARASERELATAQSANGQGNVAHTWEWVQLGQQPRIQYSAPRGFMQNVSAAALVPRLRLCELLRACVYEWRVHSSYLPR